MAYRIFANHAHVSPAEVRPNGTVADLKEMMQRCAIEKAVCFAPFRKRLLEEGLEYNQNIWLAQEIENDDSLVGFGTLDFASDSLTKQVEEIAKLGLRGIKIHPAAQEISVVGNEAFEVYAAAQELGLFLSFHTGIHWYRIRDYQPVLFDELVHHFPRLQFSMEHIGGYHFFREALAVICNDRELPPRVFSGWTSIEESQNGMSGSWSLTDDELRTVIHQSGNHRSIFGLDFPFKRDEKILASIRRIENLDIPHEAKEGIFGQTLADVLGIPF